MDTDVYRYMLVLAECKSISEASRRLYISQPALTKCLHRLESSSLIGGKLIDRSSNPIRFTPAGEVFLDYAKRYIALEHEMQEQLYEALKLQKGNIRVATTARGGLFIGPYIGPFMERYPHIVLELPEMSARKCEQMIECGEAELGVFTAPVQSDNLEYVCLTSDRLFLAVPRDHFLVEGKDTSCCSFDHPVELDAEELRDPRIRFVCSTKDHGMYQAERVFFEEYGIKQENPIRIDALDTRYRAATSGAGIVLINEWIHQSTDLAPVYCTIRGKTLSRDVIIAKKKGCQLSASGKFFWDYIIQSCSKQGLEMQ